MKNVATEKQKEYAKDISYYMGFDLPQSDSMEEYAKWLDKYVPLYKKSIYEESLMREAEMDAIDARRDW